MVMLMMMRMAITTAKKTTMTKTTITMMTKTTVDKTNICSYIFFGFIFWIFFLIFYLCSYLRRIWGGTYLISRAPPIFHQFTIASRRQERTLSPGPISTYWHLQTPASTLLLLQPLGRLPLAGGYWTASLNPLHLDCTTLDCTTLDCTTMDCTTLDFWSSTTYFYIGPGQLCLCNFIFNFHQFIPPPGFNGDLSASQRHYRHYPANYRHYPANDHKIYQMDFNLIYLLFVPCCCRFVIK